MGYNSFAQEIWRKLIIKSSKKREFGRALIYNKKKSQLTKNFLKTNKNGSMDEP